MDPAAPTSPSKATGSSEPTESTDPPEDFDIDIAELLELYRRIPPPDLRGETLRVARERIVSNVVRKVKDDGIFDSFRKAWLKDLETKPQFQNLIRRVDIRCTESLAGLTWTPDVNKTQVREKLQKHIDSHNFVDGCINDLLHEFNTGRYANPLPKQHFDESVTRVVGQTVHRYIQSATPNFPRVKSSQSGASTDDEMAGRYNNSSSVFDFDFPALNPSGTTSLHPSDPYALHNGGTGKLNSRPKSPEIRVVDMEISSPESDDTADSDARPRLALPNTPVQFSIGRATKKITECTSGFNGWRDDSPKGASVVKTETPVITTDNNEDLQGALGLLMLAGDWSQFVEENDDSQESRSSQSADLNSPPQPQDLPLPPPQPSIEPPVPPPPPTIVVSSLSPEPCIDSPVILPFSSPVKTELIEVRKSPERTELPVTLVPSPSPVSPGVPSPKPVLSPVPSPKPAPVTMKFAKTEPVSDDELPAVKVAAVPKQSEKSDSGKPKSSKDAGAASSSAKHVASSVKRESDIRTKIPKPAAPTLAVKTVMVPVRVKKEKTPEKVSDLTEPLTPPTAPTTGQEPTKSSFKPAVPSKRKSPVAASVAKKISNMKVVMRIDPPSRPIDRSTVIMVTTGPPPKKPIVVTPAKPVSVPRPVAVEEPAAEPASADSALRPTRNRKSNSKYSNDNFVTVPRIAAKAPLKRSISGARKGGRDSQPSTGESVSGESIDRTSPISVGDVPGETASGTTSSSETAGRRNTIKKKKL